MNHSSKPGINSSPLVVFKYFALQVFLLMAVPVTSGAETQVFQPTHEAFAEVEVHENNFLKARQKAVEIAMRTALENALREFLGDNEFDSNRRDIGKMLKKAKRYVKSYRYLEAVDDPDLMLSQVRLEVTFFPDAVSKALSNSGVISGPVGRESVVVLINENSLSTGNRAGFWDVLPISETALTQELVEAGIQVVGRDPVRNIITEDVVMSAVRGNLPAAVAIGLKAGADVVIVGNAVSKRLSRDVTEGTKTIQATISLKVISAFKSKVLAAKSDQVTVTSKEILAGELKAFGSVSQKLVDFLLPTLNQHWEGETVTAKPTTPETPPIPLNDL